MPGGHRPGAVALVAALVRVGGDEASARIVFKEDPVAKRVVSSWPARFDAKHSLALGFRRDAGFEALVRAYLEDEGAENGVR
jgi:D-erythronate 2-dehydrogenase